MRSCSPPTRTSWSLSAAQLWLRAAVTPCLSPPSTRYAVPLFWGDDTQILPRFFPGMWVVNVQQRPALARTLVAALSVQAYEKLESPNMLLQAYPGRASMAPLLDVLMTLLHWGAAGWRRVLQQRERVHRRVPRSYSHACPTMFLAPGHPRVACNLPAYQQSCWSALCTGMPMQSWRPSRRA